MTFCVSADWHIGLQKDGILDPELNISSRIVEVFKAIDFMIDYLIKNEIKELFVAGDIFNLSNPSIFYESMLIERLQRLENNKIHTFIIPGNHDISKIDNRKHSLISLEAYSWKYINIIMKSMCLCWNILGEEYEFYLVPWGDKPELKDTSNKKIYVGHFHMTGAISGSEKLLIPETDVENSQNKNIFFYLLGHIHSQQIFQNVLYPGSLNRISLSERKEKKGFYIVEDFKDFNFVEVPDIFEYKLIEISDEEKTWDFSNLTKNDIVRIRVKSSFSDKHLYGKLVTKLINKVHNFDIEMEYDKKKFDNKELVTGLTPKQAFLKYIDLHKSEIDCFEDVKIRGLEFLEEVMSSDSTS